MWTDVVLDCVRTTDAYEEQLRARVAEYRMSSAEAQQLAADLKHFSWLLLRRVVDKETSNAHMLVRLQRRFQQRFRYDTDGLPRVWSAADEIEKVFRVARRDTLEMLERFTAMDPAAISLLNIPSLVRSFSLHHHGTSPDFSGSFRRVDPIRAGETRTFAV